MSSAPSQMNRDPDRERMRRNLRLTLWLGLLALTFYVGFFFAVSNRG